MIVRSALFKSEPARNEIKRKYNHLFYTVRGTVPFAVYLMTDPRPEFWDITVPPGGEKIWQDMVKAIANEAWQAGWIVLSYIFIKRML